MTRWLLLSILAATASACSASAPQNELGSTRDPMLRGTPDQGHPSVVGVVSSYWKSGGFYRTACTGTYIAPRLVLTAAHCIPRGPGTTPWKTRVFVGADLKTAYESMDWFAQPAADGPWSEAETVKVNPQFSLTTYYGDIATVSLSRELPVAVTPVAKRRLDDRKIGDLGEMVGYGATLSDQMLTQTEGWGLKRQGQAPFLGSPPAGMETDHPGIGREDVRDSLAMFDGRAPNSNTCAGDSGGPILMNRGDDERVFGVSSWTGFYCEDYSFYTRIDPFLEFVEDGIELAGRGPIEPTLECVRPLPDGNTRAYFGYFNHNDVSLEIPFGAANRLPADSSGFRPTHFGPGERHFVVAADYGKKENPFWKVKAPNDRAGIAVGGKTTSPRCGETDFAPVATDACMTMALADCGQSVEDCVADQLWQYIPDDPCSQTFADYVSCLKDLRPEQFECSGGYAWDIPGTPCEEKMLNYWMCGM